MKTWKVTCFEVISCTETNSLTRWCQNDASEWDSNCDKGMKFVTKIENDGGTVAPEERKVRVRERTSLDNRNN